MIGKEGYIPGDSFEVVVREIIDQSYDEDGSRIPVAVTYEDDGSNLVWYSLAENHQLIPGQIARVANYSKPLEGGGMIHSSTISPAESEYSEDIRIAALASD